MPRESDVQPRRNQAKQPAWLELGARQAIDVPGAAPAFVMLQVVGKLPAEELSCRAAVAIRPQSHLSQGGFQARSMGVINGEEDRPSTCGGQIADAVREVQIRGTHLVE